MSNEITTKISSSQLQKPARDTNFAQKAAVILKDVVKQNGWAINLGGRSEHLMYEAWQTIGKYYGYTVKTGESNYIEYGEVKGFEAKAWVIDNKTGIEIGGAEAACLSDEPNWKNKPLFQQKSMAQTRAGSKALRQILGFVVALAGYSPTPAEEMVKDDLKVDTSVQIDHSRTIQPYNLKCSLCDVLISQRVASWSMGKYGVELCYDCQKKADTKVVEEGELPSESRNPLSEQKED